MQWILPWALVAALAGCVAAPPEVVQVQTTAPPPPIATGGQVLAADIPPGYAPSGSCRIWVPGVPASQQKPAGSCAELQQHVPAGALLVHGR